MIEQKMKELGGGDFDDDEDMSFGSAFDDED
jgi:hypothetical protein